MIEQLWTGIGLVGLIVGIVSFYHAQRRVEAIENRSNGRRIIARGYRRGEAITVAIQTLLLSLGIGPLINPEPVAFSRFVGVLFTVQLLLLARSIGDLVDRIRVQASRYAIRQARRATESEDSHASSL